MKVKESLNVTFDKSPPPTKLSPLVDDDVGEEEADRKNTKISRGDLLEDDIENLKRDDGFSSEDVIEMKRSYYHR
nr:hypothetical protein [Tanacetum cinerariifolium]